MKNLILNNKTSFLNELNKFCLAHQDTREIVSEDIKNDALEIINKMIPKTFDECLLYASALNALNAYIKKDNGVQGDRISYFFKEYVGTRLIKGIIDNNVECFMYYTKHNNMDVIYLLFDKIMFSFHRVSLSEEIQESVKAYSKYRIVEYDGIRKQMVAASVFKRIKNYIDYSKNDYIVHKV